MGGRLLLAHEYAHSSFMYMVAYSMGACKDASLETILVGSQIEYSVPICTVPYTSCSCLV
eukprot:scaffold201152_cov47-Attheya_sp.AAC.1